ncbi:MAG TPA: FixH family protein [Halothiobacillus sp.]|nr:FixH family protein [Halothiobacillus sp.]
MNLIFPASIGVVSIIVLFFLLKWRWPQMGRPIATVLGILSIAAYAPFGIINWPGADVVTMVVTLYIITAFILGFISPPKKDKDTKMTFHWGPAAVIIFLSVVVLLDSIFVTLASSGLSQRAAQDLLPKPDEGTKVTSFFPGTVARDFQQKERQFNQYNDALDEQIERGWKVHYGWWGSEPDVGKPASFRVAVLDREGKPIAGAVVKLHFMRPADKRKDFSATLPEISPGIYQESLSMSNPGLWQVAIHIEKGDANFELDGQTNIGLGK